MIDVQGQTITPGFIDIHTHSDLSILINRPAESAVRQSVTTHVIGNCGLSPAPVDNEHLAEVRSWWGPEVEMPGVSWEWRDFGGYLEAIQQDGIAISIGTLVGHGALRLTAMGFNERARSEVELDKMKMQAALAAGYPDPSYSQTILTPPTPDEVAAFFEKVAADRGERS